MEVILVGWFGKCQSIKKVGGRRFVEGLYQALFSFRLARRTVISSRAWSQVKTYPVDNAIGFTNTYPLNSDLPGG